MFTRALALWGGTTGERPRWLIVSQVHPPPSPPCYLFHAGRANMVTSACDVRSGAQRCFMTKEYALGAGTHRGHRSSSGMPYLLALRDAEKRRGLENVFVTRDTAADGRYELKQS